MNVDDLDEWSDWIDGQDVLMKLHISPRTLQRWRINGLLPFSQVCGKFLLPEVGYPEDSEIELQWRKW